MSKNNHEIEASSSALPQLQATTSVSAQPSPPLLSPPQGGQINPERPQAALLKPPSPTPPSPESSSTSTLKTTTRDSADHASRRDSRATDSGSSGDGDEGHDRIEGWGDIWEAIKLTWVTQRKHLFTAWVHVPLGVTFMLVCVWAVKQGINVAPFRFPAAVLVAFGFFALLLLLDWLSLKFPGKKQDDSEAGVDEKSGGIIKKSSDKPQRKRFVDPILLLLGEPMNFCLRNMSVMFTPSFILIPAREIIPGKEIGLLTAWFAISQLMGFVFPVLLNKAISWGLVKYRAHRHRLRRTPSEAEFNRSRRGSRASAVSHGRRGSNATLAGMSYEKGVSFHGGRKLGPIATGLSGLTAHVTAMVSYMPMHLNEDERRYMEGAAMEQARQQGVPDVTSPAWRRNFRFDDFKPRSDVSSFEHDGRGLHPAHAHLHRERSSSRTRSRSRSRDGRNMERSDSKGRRNGKTSTGTVSSPLAKTVSSDDDDDGMAANKASPGPLEDYRFPPLATGPSIVFEPVLPTAAALRAAEGDQDSDRDEIEVAEDLRPSQTPTAVNSRRQSLVPTQAGLNTPLNRELTGASPTPTLNGAAGILESKGDGPLDARKGSVVSNISTARSEDEEVRPDAVERLSSWMADLITPTVYFILFVVGLALWFTKDFALPLFLAINILAFLFGITVVPPKIRRFAHPILTCSIITVFVLWGFGAANGFTLKETLAKYSVDAKYDILWDPKGYRGPVPGAGDVLFSTLDAGIVALAMPMYRYRRDLRENFFRMTAVLVPCAGLALFFWPWIAWLFRMDEVRSLAFAARFMSTPLAIELAKNVGADVSITIILVVITGIIFAIVKDYFFRAMRVDDDDFLTIGLTCGSTSGAIGASSLIARPKVMAVASLAFIVYGTLLLIATAIPPIVEVVQQLAGAI